MNKLKISSLTLILGLFLSSCGGQNSVSQENFDVNADIAVIQDAVMVFRELSESAQSDASVANIARVAGLNSSAIDGVEESTKTLLANLEANWDALSSGESSNGIPREVLREWGESYLIWVSFQRQIQAIGEECLADLGTYASCQDQRLGQTIELERQSIEPLNAVQEKLRIWQEENTN